MSVKRKTFVSIIERRKHTVNTQVRESRTPRQLRITTTVIVGRRNSKRTRVPIISFKQKNGKEKSTTYNWTYNFTAGVR